MNRPDFGETFKPAEGGETTLQPKRGSEKLNWRIVYPLSFAGLVVGGGLADWAVGGFLYDGLRGLRSEEIFNRHPISTWVFKSLADGFGASVVSLGSVMIYSKIHLGSWLVRNSSMSR